MIKKLEAKMKPYLEKYNIKCSSIPMAKGTGIRKLGENEEFLDGELQSMYRSCVGSLLYITKHSRPDLCNSVRELSKVNRKACLDHFVILLTVCAFLFENKNLGVRLVKSYMDENWKLEAYCDLELRKLSHWLVHMQNTVL